MVVEGSGHSCKSGCSMLALHWYSRKLPGNGTTFFARCPIHLPDTRVGEITVYNSLHEWMVAQILEE